MKLKDDVAYRLGYNVHRAFLQLASHLGEADPVTLQRRRDFQERGFSVVFHDGMTHKQALRILDSKETLRLLVEM